MRRIRLLLRLLSLGVSPSLGLELSGLGLKPLTFVLTFACYQIGF